ncbi:MAG: hypothetical protein JWP25_7164 [Bradyrhizobium sp.]|jgi:hypothetical protein|nr:hypothetical protein [Bradyrhizobium sp.]
MLDFDAGAVLRALTMLRSLETQTSAMRGSGADTEAFISKASVEVIAPLLDQLRLAVVGLSVPITKMAIEEMQTEMGLKPLTLRYEGVVRRTTDIARTLRREFSSMKTFFIESSKEPYFNIEFGTFGSKFQTVFPSAVFEIDEAGKCHALGRTTACVFHLMRSMEIAIKAIARSISIPDPVKDAEKNWGKILGSIKDEIKKRDSALPQQWENDDRHFFTDMHLALDTVRIAWRNTTMHVENKYTEDESEHILVAVRSFMKKLSARMDESGLPLA